VIALPTAKEAVSIQDLQERVETEPPKDAPDTFTKGEPPQGLHVTETTYYYGVRFSSKAWLAQRHDDLGYCVVGSPSCAFWTENRSHAEQVASDHAGTLVEMTMTIKTPG
jgi:hypothetical protein